MSAREPSLSALSASRRRSLAAGAGLLAGALTISTTPILVRLAHTGPAAVGFWRLFLALPLLALWAGGARVDVGRPRPVLIFAGVMFALDLGCWHYGIGWTSVANATLLPNLTPVLVTLAGWLLLKEKPRPIFLVGLAAAVAGALLMAAAHATGSVAEQGRAHLGDALSASTAVWYGLYFVAVRAARAERSTPSILIWTSLVGAPLLLAAAVALRETLVPSVAAGWWALAGLAVVHVFGQGAIAWALGRLQAAAASLLVLIQPVVSAALAWALFGERLSALQAVGGALALAGIGVAQIRLSGRRLEREPFVN